MLQFLQPDRQMKIYGVSDKQDPLRSPLEDIDPAPFQIHPQRPHMKGIIEYLGINTQYWECMQLKYCPRNTLEQAICQ